MQKKSLGFINVDGDTTGKLLITYSAFVKYLRKNRNIRKQFINYLKCSRKLIIQLGEMSCVIFSLNLVST